MRITLAALMLAAASPALAYPVTVKSCDREVTFDAAPKAAVSNDVNLTEMMLVLGLADHMIGYSGISGWSKLDAAIREGVKELPELSEKYPSREVLLGAATDFYFAGWNYGMRVGGEVTPETLAPYDIKVYELTESCTHIMQKDKSSMEDMYADIANLGTIFDVSDKAAALIDGWRKELAGYTASLPPLATPPRVFIYDSGEDGPFTAGRFAMPTAIIEAAGGVNIMDDLDKSWAKIGWEPVIDRNPEVVVIVNYGDVTAKAKIAFMKNNPAFANMDAVRNDRFVVLEYVEATPGPRNIAAVRKLAETLRAN
jgi:iron complex transport system substrate-binding protein